MIFLHSPDYIEFYDLSFYVLYRISEHISNARECRFVESFERDRPEFNRFNGIYYIFYKNKTIYLNYLDFADLVLKQRVKGQK